jgi:hypothetical protein
MGGVVRSRDAGEGTDMGAGSLSDTLISIAFGLGVSLEVRIGLLVPIQRPEDEDADTDGDDRVPVHGATEVGDPISSSTHEAKNSPSRYEENP